MPPGFTRASLRGLRELAICKMRVSDACAAHLAASLEGHAALETLELYNVNLEDAGAVAVAQLARPGGNAALRKLDLGKHKVFGETVVDLKERIVDTARVHLKVY